MDEHHKEFAIYWTEKAMTEIKRIEDMENRDLGLTLNDDQSFSRPLIRTLQWAQDSLNKLIKDGGDNRVNTYSIETDSNGYLEGLEGKELFQHQRLSLPTLIRRETELSLYLIIQERYNMARTQNLEAIKYATEYNRIYENPPSPLTSESSSSESSLFP